MECAKEEADKLERPIAQALHTVSFDWFLSGLETFWNFIEKYNRISDLGLTLPHFEFLSLYLDMLDQNWSFLHKKWRLWSRELGQEKMWES